MSARKTVFHVLRPLYLLHKYSIKENLDSLSGYSVAHRDRIGFPVPKKFQKTTNLSIKKICFVRNRLLNELVQWE